MSLFDLEPSGSELGSSGMWVPKCTVEEHGATVVVRASVPLGNISNVRVKVDPERVTIRGTKRMTRGVGTVVQGSFQFSCKLPVAVDPKSAVSEIHGGMLHLTMQKVVASAPKATLSVKLERILREARVEESESARRS